MTPYFADDWLTVYQGDCRAVLAELPADSVDCVVTSPPYWGLRDYGEPGQLGLEPTPEEYVANMVGVFREVGRILRPSGTVWLNLGDSYSGSWAGHSMRPEGGSQRPGGPGFQPLDARVPARQPNVHGLKPKDLVGIPWRVAFALQADGWYLRSDIIWSKPNPMPESVTDRPTKAHEYIFLLSKSARYYFDAEAVREASGDSREQWLRPRYIGAKHNVPNDQRGDTGRVVEYEAGRNIRSVWQIATRPYAGAHFAVFPPEIPERCIKAGSSERGVCPNCGAPWERMVEKTVEFTSGSGRSGRNPDGKNGSDYQQATSGTYDIRLGPVVQNETTGWKSSCSHASEPVPAVVLDPFGGSGTTGMVANRLSRRAILVDLSTDYLDQAMVRNAQTVVGL
jgi:DNA modification methylase